MKRARRFRGLLGLAVVLCGAGALLASWAPARSVALLAPSLTGFTRAGPDVWVERGMAPETRDAVVLAVAAAKGRLSRFYGTAAGRPIVLACSTERCFRRCGGIGHGTAYFADRVLVGPAALNVVKITHELSHVEVAARVGALRALLRVPQWFDEGLAVVISEDPLFDERSWLAASGGGTRAPALERLVSLRGWRAVTRVDGQLSYGTARHEVARWYARAGLAGLERLFSLLRDGARFDDAYASVARAAPPDR